MRDRLPDILEDARIHPGGLTSRRGDLFGVFQITGPTGANLRMISSGHDLEYRWEHVSVSVRGNRCPNWPEMAFVKDLFWSNTEMVMQLHPPQASYVNYHPYCLHLWKPIGLDIPAPPPVLVGPLGEGK